MPWVNVFFFNHLLVNCDKTTVMLFGSEKHLARSQGLSLFLLGKLLELSNTVKYLGLIFVASMDWHEHINNICNKVTRRLNLLGRIRKYLDRDTSKLSYTSLVQPLMEYCDIVMLIVPVFKDCLGLEKESTDYSPMEDQGRSYRKFVL